MTTMFPLQNVTIEDYRAFAKQEIDFQEITSFVGANESGKTNLLDVLYHLAPEQQLTQFSPEDLRLGAPNYPNGQITIKYKLKLTNNLMGRLRDTFPEIEGRSVTLTKRGKPKEDPSWSCESTIAPSSVKDIVKINNPEEFRQQFSADESDLEWAKTVSQAGWFANDSSIDLRKNPFNGLIRDNVISLLSGAKKTRFLNKQLLKPEVLANIKIYMWQYREEDFLKESVPLDEFIQNPEHYRSVANMFIISGWDTEDFATHLQGQTHSVYRNLLNPVEREINKLIEKQWTSHPNLKIELDHKGDYLTIHLQETGSSTPPEFRSDGLKWFLTFLINFRAVSEQITDYILLIDEPGLHLHPRGQKDALKEIENLAQDNQIIYTTHQTFLINKNNPERVRILYRDVERRGALSRNPFYATRCIAIEEPKHILTDPLLREALGFNVSDISPINERNILVEGVFDRDLLQFLNGKWKIVDLNNTSIIACQGGAGGIVKHAELYKSNDLEVVCLYDSDNIGQDAYNNNRECKERRDKFHIQEFTHDKAYETMEDLVPDAPFNTAFTEWASHWGISAKKIPTRPVMKDVSQMLKDESKPQKLQMKHDLEDRILKEVKEDFQKNRSDYSLLQHVLKGLKK